MNNIDKLNWRYATKMMNGEKIPKVKLEAILEAIQFAPSSYGIQPYSIFVISDAATKEKLAPACYNQPQITKCSELVVFAAWNYFEEKQIDEYMKLIADTRNIPVESLNGFKSSMITLTKLSTEDKNAWAKKQAYIALGYGLMEASIQNVDSTPMEGFQPAEVDKVLDLESRGLKSTVLLALGYRDESDSLAKLKKVRRDKDKLFTFI